MKRKRAGAIIVRDGKILLIYRKKNDREYYIIPGGGVQEGESFEQAVVREAREEVVLDVTIEKLFCAYSDERSDQQYFVCAYSAGEPTIGDIQEFDNSTNTHRLEWIPIKELSGIALYPPEVQKSIIDSFENGGVDAPYTHIGDSRDFFGYKRRAFLVHGWEGSPRTAFKPWLKTQLESHGYEVAVPSMPDTVHPKVEEWIPFLHKLIQHSDEHTVLVGHSLGCKALLLYLQELPEDVCVGKLILVAPVIDEVTGLDEAGEKILKPWRDAVLDYEKIKRQVNSIVVFFDDTDPWIPLASEEIVREKLGAKTIIEHDRHHFSDSIGKVEVPTVLAEILH
ncbi:MAG: alpha/beta hydrolase [bacterium]|nr:alpha/beta hydrolase [bacterium]